MFFYSPFPTDCGQASNFFLIAEFKVMWSFSIRTLNDRYCRQTEVYEIIYAFELENDIQV